MSLAVEMPDDFRAAVPQRLSAQAAGLSIGFLARRMERFRAGYGGVRGDNSSDVSRSGQFQNFIQCRKNLNLALPSPKSAWRAVGAGQRFALGEAR
jgi:hypothetical protein